MASIFDRRFVIVSGKGGTGKTTLAAALALAAQRRGLRVLVAELNVPPRIPGIFGAPQAGYEPRPIHDGIECANIVPDDCLREYGLMKLRFQRLYRFVFENETMRRVMGMIPGVNELLILGKLAFMEGETVRRGQRPRWDLIVVDGPATGHGISMFRLPSVILSAVSAGPLAEDARRMDALLKDRARTSFEIVAVPEEMAVQEAIELSRTVRSVLEIPLGRGLLNMVWPKTVEAEEWERIAPLLARADDPALAPLHATVSESEARHAHQAPMVARAKEGLAMPVVELPYLFTRRVGLPEIQQLGALLDRGSEVASWEMRNED
jgi:anion-transporting  ArsA/GET3 family ATPase